MRSPNDADGLEWQYLGKRWALSPECYVVLHNCFRRISCWRVPPNWSRSDWLDEIEAHGIAASWQAVCDYDPRRAVPLEKFVYQRIIARALTRHRQEWRYAQRVVPERAANSVPARSNPLRIESINHHPTAISQACHAYEELLDALANLPQSSQLLIEQLFWQEQSEEDISQALRICRRAVNKRKHVILRFLRGALKTSKETQKTDGPSSKRDPSKHNCYVKGR
jgi:RNA polymerase sigma factor (sigma-70 family)